VSRLVPYIPVEQGHGVFWRNENDTWGNNATGTWHETFQFHLGRTAAGLDDRLRVLNARMRSKDPRERRLVAEALGQAIGIGGESRSGMPPSDVDGMPAEAWRPRTRGEWSGALELYCSLLARLVEDADDGVALEAAQEQRVCDRRAGALQARFRPPRRVTPVTAGTTGFATPGAARHAPGAATLRVCEPVEPEPCQRPAVCPFSGGLRALRIPAFPDPPASGPSSRFAVHLT
jgi:hypothetical protein